MLVPRILVIDNYDSFVYNLVQYLAQLGAHVDVIRNDVEPDLAGYHGVLISPGPGTPEQAGSSIGVVKAATAANLPLLGVCLGHQAIGVAFGATVGRAPELLHGKTSTVIHHGAGVLAPLPHPFTATRYHSLAIDPGSLPAELQITATTESGVIMAIRHRSAPIEGVQFHPESVLTEGGHRLIGAWLGSCGADVDAGQLDVLDAEMAALRASAFTAP